MFSDEFTDIESDESDSRASVSKKSSALFSRRDPYTEDEQRAIDQYGFLWPDYCVCVRPNEAQMVSICQQQAALIEDNTIVNLYPKDSLQIEYVEDTTHVPYDFCYDDWQRNGVTFNSTEFGRNSTAEKAGPAYIRPDYTQAEKDFFYWQDAYTSDIKMNAYEIEKQNLTDWSALLGEKGSPPPQVDMSVNGYWDLGGFCTCYEPTILPPALIIVFQLLGLFWQIDTMLWFTLPWSLLTWVWNLVDFIIDWVFIGIFIWFKPIAYVFIWIINIAQLPLNLFGWMNELMTQLHKLPLVFWMWFTGDGCFLRWGKNCWFDQRIPFRTDQTFMDIPFFAKGVIDTVVEPQKPVFTNTASWSFDFEERLGFGNIIDSIKEFQNEQKLNNFIEERKQQRAQKMLKKQAEFDSTALGLAIIKLGAWFNDIYSPIDF